MQKILLITGLLRNFSHAVQYMEEKQAFSNYQVKLSTWDTQVEENAALLKRFEHNGGQLITTPAIHFGKYTSVVSQHLSLSRGLTLDIPSSCTVLKTRTDWMVEHNILDDFQNINFNNQNQQILTSGFIPSSPYFLPDGHFVSSAETLKRVSNLDLIDILRFSYLHPEQNFFLSSFGERSSPLENWLAIDIGTQFESLATSQWVKLRLKSGLYFYIYG
jgi:hypothetical protein